MLILQNTFHHTETKVRPSAGIISARALKEAKGRLCGISDCQCGGIRGVVMDSEGNTYGIEEHPQGHAYVVRIGGCW